MPLMEYSETAFGNYVVSDILVQRHSQMFRVITLCQSLVLKIYLNQCECNKSYSEIIRIGTNGCFLLGARWQCRSANSFQQNQPREMLITFQANSRFCDEYFVFSFFLDFSLFIINIQHVEFKYCVF